MQLIGSATNVARAEDARESSDGAQTMSSVADTAAADENIAKLAYALWHYRGCPIGSPELDWIEAESQLRRPAGRL